MAPNSRLVATRSPYRPVTRRVKWAVTAAAYLAGVGSNHIYSPKAAAAEAASFSVEAAAEAVACSEEVGKNRICTLKASHERGSTAASPEAIEQEPQSRRWHPEEQSTGSLKRAQRNGGRAETAEPAAPSCGSVAQSPPSTVACSAPAPCGTGGCLEG